MPKINTGGGNSILLTNSQTVLWHVNQIGSCQTQVSADATLNLGISKLTGLLIPDCNTARPIVSNDTVITALGQLQGQISCCCNNRIVSVTDNENGVVIVNNADPRNPVVEFNGVYTDGVTITGNGTAAHPLVSVGGGGGGTVTAVSSGNLSPLFTVNVGTPNTTPAFTFSAVSQNQNLVYASPDGVAGVPLFRTLRFTELNDVPSTYVGEAFGFPTVNSTETGLVFTDIFSSTPILAKAATTALLGGSPVYNNGASGVGATLTGTGALPVQDGVALAVGERLLVKNQGAKLQNGVYSVTIATPNYKLTRTVDSDATSEFDPQVVFVTQGTVNRRKYFTQTTVTPNVGASNIVYVKGAGGAQTISLPNTQIAWGTGTSISSSPNLEYIETGTSATLIMTDPTMGSNPLIVVSDNAGNSNFQLAADNFSASGSYSLIGSSPDGSIDLQSWAASTNLARLTLVTVDFPGIGLTHGIYMGVDNNNLAQFSGTSLDLRGGNATQYALRFYEQADNFGVNYVGFIAAPTIATPITWILPNTDSTGTQALVSDGSGNLSWASISGSAYISSVGNTSTINLTVSGGGQLTADFATLNISQFTNDVPYVAITGSDRNVFFNDAGTLGTDGGINYDKGVKQLILADGNAKNPSYCFNSANKTGMFFDGTSLAFTTNGTEAWAIDNTQVLYPFTDCSNIGIAGTNRIGTIYMCSNIDFVSTMNFTVSGTPVFVFDNSGNVTTGIWQGTAIADTYISSASTWNAKQSAITFGTGVQTALGVNIGSAGAPVLFNGAGGTPSSLTGTNISGTASSLTAGHVTTNANLTGDVTSVGNATTIAANSVTYAKMQAVSTTSKLLGSSSTTTAVQELSLGTGLNLSGTTLSATGTGGTVTTVSVTTANGISGSVATATTTPAITLTLGAITPTTVNGITLSGSGSIANSGTTALTGFTGSGTSSGTNTGDQTIGGLSPLTTKGDLFTFSTVNTRLGIGADATIFMSDAAATTGNKWIAVSGDITIALTGVTAIGATKIATSMIQANAVTLAKMDASNATANKMLLSGASASPTWSTSTIPTSAGATANKILLSDGTNYVLSTPTFPNASATTRKIIVSDGTNWIASTETYAVPGTSGNILTSDGTNWTSAAATSGAIVVGTTVISSGTGTRLVYETSGNRFGEISGATSDGTSVTFGSANLLATRPKITTSIDDSNGNQMLAFTATTTSVDYFTFINAATANPATIKIQATGSDSNVSVLLSPKGTGKAGLTDGTDLTKIFNVDLSGATTATTLTLVSSNALSRTLTFPAMSGNRSVAYIDQAQTFTAAKTFTTTALQISNPAATFSYTITSAAIGANRALTLPLITGSDTLAALGLAQSFSATQTFVDIKIGTVGNGLYIKEGSNATMGIATLSGGTVTVATTKVTASSRIFLEVQSLGTVAVATPVAITARSAGVSFTITSSSITDTSVIAWIIIEPA